MIDDEDSKIRRNIVVVSAGILLAAYLELPAAWLMASMLPKETPHIEQYKFWGVGFALLLYLGLRYRFSVEGGEAAGSIKKEVALFRYDRMRRSLHLPQDNFLDYSRAKEIFPDIDSSIAEARQIHSLTKAYTAVNPSFVIQALVQRDPTTLSASIELRFARKDAQPTIVPLSNQPTTTWPPVEAFFKFGLPAHINAFFYSAGAIKQLAPLLLAIAAEVVLLCRFGVAFWTA